MLALITLLAIITLLLAVYFLVPRVMKVLSRKRLQVRTLNDFKPFTKKKK